MGRALWYPVHVKRKRVERPNIVRAALEAREQMDDHLRDPVYFRTVVEPFSVIMAGMYAAPVMAETLVVKWGRALRVGEVYAVTPDMFYLVERAGADLPDDYVAEHHHLHAEHGFLWLPENIIEPRGVGADPVSLMTWHNGTGVSHRVPGSIGTATRAAGIEINLWHRERDGVLRPVGSDFLPYGIPALGWRSYGFEGEREILEPEQHLSNSTRFVLALQMLMRQELPSMTRWGVPRSDLRDLRRRAIPENDVTVIALRRRAYTEHPDTEPSGRHLSCRFIVRGHWARYWVGPTHPQHPGGTEDKVAIYLYRNPHYRGPEDAPLKVTPQRVHVVRR